MLGMLGDTKKMASLIVSGKGMMGDKPYYEERGEGSERDQEDNLSPMRMMTAELFTAIKEGDEERGCAILCSMIGFYSKEKKEVEINL